MCPSLAFVLLVVFEGPLTVKGSEWLATREEQFFSLLLVSCSNDCVLAFQLLFLSLCQQRAHQSVTLTPCSMHPQGLGERMTGWLVPQMAGTKPLKCSWGRHQARSPNLIAAQSMLPSIVQAQNPMLMQQMQVGFLTRA